MQPACFSASWHCVFSFNWTQIVCGESKKGEQEDGRNEFQLGLWILQNIEKTVCMERGEAQRKPSTP